MFRFLTSTCLQWNPEKHSAAGCTLLNKSAAITMDIGPIINNGKSPNPLSKLYKADVADEEFVVPFRYQDLESVGRGSQGTVCSAKDLVTAKKVAIKKIAHPFRNATSARRAYREIRLLQILDHKNIVQIIHAFTPDDSLENFKDMYIVTEFVEAGLYKLIDVGPTHEQMSYIIYQLLCGIKHVHSSGVVHRDLRPSNIMVQADCTLKITDMGLARRLGNTSSMSPYVISKGYRAPEVFLGMHYDHQVDMWSIGCIFGEMIRGTILFPSTNYIDHWDKITEQLGSPNKHFFDKLDPNVRKFMATWRPFHGMDFERLFPNDLFSEDGQGALGGMTANNARDLLSKMLVIDPEGRISINDALAHPYIKFWYEDEEVDVLALEAYDSSMETRDFTPAEWKEILYEEITLVNEETNKSVDGIFDKNIIEEE